ncbi:hypothetical protein [Efunavirus EF1]|uniref:Uncharacterized protein n=1 Tax=Enterococcus phage EF1 TaxID=2025813 RepID=A0A249XXW7_9CAUD|nr:hypothetical protein [Enterococcus phage EF1]
MELRLELDLQLLFPPMGVGFMRVLQAVIFSEIAFGGDGFGICENIHKSIREAAATTLNQSFKIENRMTVFFLRRLTVGVDLSIVLPSFYIDTRVNVNKGGVRHGKTRHRRRASAWFGL